MAAMSWTLYETVRIILFIFYEIQVHCVKIVLLCYVFTLLSLQVSRQVGLR